MKYGIKTYASEPTPVRRLWILAAVLIVAVSLLGVLGWKYFKNQPVREQPDKNLTVAPDTPVGINLRGKYCYAGEPRPTSAFHGTILVLTNVGYVAGYSEQLKDPVWVCYRLFKVNSLQAPPRPQKFDMDSRTVAGVTSADYTSSGYDRGHMAPNFAIAVCYGAQAQLETFLMSNILPQKPHLNRGVWERLESQEIREYAQRYETIWVIDGPVFGDHPTRLKAGVAISTKCYKIIAREERGMPSVMAFIMPQDVTGNESPSQFVTSVREIENQTRLNFFSELPGDVQDRVETGRRGM